MRRPLVAANWKMHHDSESALRFAHRLPELRDAHPGVDLAIFPPATLLMLLARALSPTHVRVGAQCCHFERRGAYTGEISAGMVADTGATLVLAGHSERRQLFGESDAIVGRKVRAALDAGLEVVLCIGESEAERDAGRTEDVLARQLAAALVGVSPAEAASLTVAYEPVWAIGTGRTATPAQARDAHAFTRRCLAKHVGPEAAEGLRILYGGSIKPDNAAELFAQPDVDGGLIGGASLEFESYAAIAAAADRAP